MLQVQQQMIEELQYQLSSNPPLPGRLCEWAEHPVTIYFLNQFRINALDQDLDPWSETLVTDAKLIAGYNKCVNDMEEAIQDFKDALKGEDDDS